LFYKRKSLPNTSLDEIYPSISTKEWFRGKPVRQKEGDKLKYGYIWDK